MKPLPHNADLLGVAPHVIWFDPPEKALGDPVRFLTRSGYRVPDQEGR